LCFAIKFDKSRQKLTTGSIPVAYHQWATVGIPGQKPMTHWWHANWVITTMLDMLILLFSDNSPSEST